MKHACTLALASCARNWEVFRSDWRVRAVANDASVLKQTLSDRLLAIARENSESGRLIVDGLQVAGVQLEVHLDKYPHAGDGRSASRWQRQEPAKAVGRELARCGFEFR
jgi:hypothetical protein